MQQYLKLKVGHRKEAGFLLQCSEHLKRFSFILQNSDAQQNVLSRKRDEVTRLNSSEFLSWKEFQTPHNLVLEYFIIGNAYLIISVVINFKTFSFS